MGCSTGKYIDSVFIQGWLSTIDNSSGCTGSLPNVSTLYFDTVCLYQNHPIALRLTDATLSVSVYIDYNHDGLFSGPGEQILFSPGGNINPIGSFLVPVTALSGITKMRIMAADSIITDPCGNYTYGETEEYFVNILQPAPGGLPSCGCITSSSLQLQACDSVVSPSYQQIWYSSGNYQDTLINMNNCDSIIFVNVTIDTLDDSIYQQSDTLWAADSNAQYQWYDCTSQTVVVGETAQWFKPSVSGLYACILSNGSCTDTSSCITYLPSTIRHNIKSNVLVYPNPAQMNINVLLPFYNGVLYEFEIYDLVGSRIFTSFLKKESNQIHLPKLCNGLYTYSIIKDRVLIDKGRLIIIQN